MLKSFNFSYIYSRNLGKIFNFPKELLNQNTLACIAISFSLKKQKRKRKA
jgi:hypothetical protein